MSKPDKDTPPEMTFTRSEFDRIVYGMPYEMFIRPEPERPTALSGLVKKLKAKGL